MNNFAVIFDMDGVLVDSEVHWKAVESTFLRRFIPHWDDNAQRRIFGMSIHDVYSFLCSDYGLDITKQEYLAGYDSLGSEIYGVRSSLLPGASEIVATLDALEIPLALASSSTRNWIDIVLDRFSLRHYFSHVASGDDVQGRGKPFPDIYLNTISALGIAPERCVAVEDSPKGIRSAKSAGIHCLGFRNGFNDHHDLSEADVVIDDLGRITGLLSTNALDQLR